MKVREINNARVGFTYHIRMALRFNRFMLLRYPRQGLAPLNPAVPGAEKVREIVFVKYWQ